MPWESHAVHKALEKRHHINGSSHNISLHDHSSSPDELSSVITSRLPGKRHVTISSTLQTSMQQLPLTTEQNQSHFSTQLGRRLNNSGKKEPFAIALLKAEKRHGALAKGSIVTALLEIGIFAEIAINYSCFLAIFYSFLPLCSFCLTHKYVMAGIKLNLLDAEKLWEDLTNGGLAPVTADSTLTKLGVPTPIGIPLTKVAKSDVSCKMHIPQVWYRVSLHHYFTCLFSSFLCNRFHQ